MGYSPWCCKESDTTEQLNNKWQVMLRFLPYACLSLVYLFGEVCIQIFCLFFNQVVCFLIIEVFFSLYILDYNPISDVFFANIFSQSVACLFILLTLRYLQMETRGQTVLNPKQDFSISVLLTFGAG